MGEAYGNRGLDFFKHDVAPLMQRRATEKNTSRSLKPGHLVRRTQTAILAWFVLVPMHQNNREAQYNENCEGSAKKRNRTPEHTVAIIVPGTR